MKLVVASNNPGKLREISAMLPGFELIAQNALNIPEAEEPHDTFVENALAKARHASRAAGLPALADDSGLCVPALGGEPGVHSAYYAGREGNREERDTRNNQKLTDALFADPLTRGSRAERRAGGFDLSEPGSVPAYYVCVMVLVRHPNDPRPLIAEGLWHGEIARAPRGSGGFGYDPLFLLPNGKTAAELTAEEKNRISHRALALKKLLELLRA